MDRVSALTAALLCLSLSVRASADPTAADSDRERALALFREGNRAFSRGELHSAYEAYQQAWALHRSFDVACNLGRTETELELHVPAAEHLDYCLRTFATSGKLGLRDAERKFRQLFEKVRAKVGGLRVTSRPIEAEVLIDGASMGEGPLDRDLFMKPGQRRVVVRAKGFVDRVELLTVTPGSAHSIDAQLQREPAQAKPAPSAAKAERPANSSVAVTTRTETAESRRPSGPEPRTLAVATGAGLTLVGLGLGLAFAMDAERAADETDELWSEIGGNCAPGSADPRCSAHSESIDHEQRSRNVANLAFAASGVVGAVTVGLWFILPERDAERVAGVRPWVGTTHGGLSFTGCY